MGTANHTKEPDLGFYLEPIGLFLPPVLFLLGVGWLGISGAPDERGFWPILVLALFAGLLLARDKRAWCEAVLDGMSERLVALMILSWLLAGVFATLMNATGMVEALVWSCQTMGVGGGGYVAASFLIAAAVSTSTGTSLGTLILTVPLLYPPAGSLAADPLLQIGALIGGATFGDNVSPVSDTTIASAASQGAAMHTVVRSRLQYALPAAALALVVYAGLGSGGSDGSSSPLDVHPGGLVMLIAPIVVLATLLLRRHLIEGLAYGNLAALAVGLATGRLQLDQLLFIDRENFVARGLLADGIERGVGISIFTLLLMGLVKTIERTGLVDRVIEVARGRAESARSAEIWIAAVTTTVVMLTTHAAVTLLTVGGFARAVGEAHHLSPQRRANLLDLVVSVWPFVLPWFIPTILASSLTRSGAEMGMPVLPAWQVGLSNAHSWALLSMTVVAIVFGYGRALESTFSSD